MASTIDQFRQYRMTTLTLPSGLIVDLLRKPSVALFLGLGELPIPATQEGETAAGMSVEALMSIQHYVDRAIAGAVLAPSMTDERDAQGRPVITPDKLHVTELDPDDYALLSRDILTRMGLVQEEARAIESFCPDTVSPTDPGISEGISFAPITGARTDAG